jgi:hypothetical protein
MVGVQKFPLSQGLKFARGRVRLDSLVRLEKIAVPDRRALKVSYRKRYHPEFWVFRNFALIEGLLSRSRRYLTVHPPSMTKAAP